MRLLKCLALLCLLFFPALAVSGDKLQAMPEPQISITGAIDLLSETTVRSALEDSGDAEHLYILIDSPGGSVVNGLHIIRDIRASGIPTTCYVGTMAASMAAVIFESNACGERIMYPGSLLMFHGASDPTGGNEKDHQNALSALQAMNWMMARIAAPRMKMTPSEFYRKISSGEEIWADGVTAVAQKMADRVVPDLPPVKEKGPAVASP